MLLFLQPILRDMRFLAALLLFSAAPLSAQEAAWEQVYAADYVSSVTVLSTGTVLAGTVLPGAQPWIEYPRVLRSVDSGASWALTESVSSFSLTAFPDGTAMVAGPLGIYSSEDDGQSWVQELPYIFGHSQCSFDSWWTLVAALPDGSTLVGAHASSGLPTRSSTTGCTFRGASQWSAPEADTWTPTGVPLIPLAFAAAPSGELWMGGTSYASPAPSLSRSTDGGATWESVQGPYNRLVRALLATADGMLFAGSGDTARPTLSTSSAIAPVFATPNSQGLYRSSNGETWTLVADLATREVLALTADDDGQIYAGTDAGVFRSTDGGTTWAAINAGLTPNSRVTALRTTPDGYLIAGIEGRGLFRVAAGITTDNEDTSGLPSVLSLHAAYPNPFASSTTLTFDLPAPARVTLTVFDVLGREAAVVLDEQRAAGTHNVTWTPTGLPSGIYIARLETGGGVQTRRLILTR